MGSYDDYGKAELGDERLSKRLARLLQQLSGNPAASISAACQDPYQAKAAYRFVGNDEVSTEAITKITQEVTVGRINGAKPSVLLIPQDTTELNYSGLLETKGLGTIGGKSTTRGFIVHSSIAVAETGEVFGLLAQKQWIRPPEELGKTKNRRFDQPIEEKESYKWLETIEKSNISVPDGTTVVHICDREGDIYELFCKAESENTRYLCRRRHERGIEDEDGAKLLTDFVKMLPVADIINVQVPKDSHTKRSARNAEIEVKYGKCKLIKTRRLYMFKDLPESIYVYVISAVEKDVPQGEEGISWQLITNVPTESFEDAVTRIAWYTQRWKIETFHRTLKSGCKVEELQSESAGKLMKLVAIYSIIALQIILLSYIVRTRPDDSCELYLAEDEWKILYRVANKTKKLPEEAPTIHEAVVMIAKLGGFLARRSDGFPGVTVIWRGLTSLYTILDAAPFLA